MLQQSSGKIGFKWFLHNQVPQMLVNSKRTKCKSSLLLAPNPVGRQKKENQNLLKRLDSKSSKDSQSPSIDSENWLLNEILEFN